MRVRIQVRQEEKDHKLNDQIALKAYELWKDNFTVSVDTRNKRNMIKISKNKIHLLCKSIADLNVSIIETKFGHKFQPHRYIYMKSLRTMHSNFIKTNLSISISTLYRLKPFDVVQQTLGETETCGCIKCMNLHHVYNTIKKHDSQNDYPSSLTE